MLYELQLHTLEKLVLFSTISRGGERFSKIGAVFHSYGSTVPQLGTNWSGEGQTWKKSLANSRPQQLQGKVSSKSRAAPIYCTLLRMQDESWPLSVSDSDSSTEQGLWHLGISFPGDFEGGGSCHYTYHFSLFFSSFPYVLSLLKLYLQYPACSDLPRKEKATEFSKALLLLSAFKTERGSLEQLTEKNRHYLKITRAGLTGSNL